MGILIGLYLKISIALILFLLIFLKINKNKKIKKYLKIIFNKKNILIFSLAIIISFFTVTTKLKIYNKIYLKKEIKTEGIIVKENIKEFNNYYEIKIENKKFILKTNKKVHLEYGDKIYLEGNYIKPDTARNYKGFDYSKYLKSKNIYGTIEAKQVNIIKKGQINIFLKIANSVRNDLNKRIKKIFKYNGVVEGILLGEKNNLDGNLISDFQRAGLSHVLAVSGMHLSYIVLGLNYLLRKNSVNFKYVFLIFSIFIFMAIINYTPSITRAGIMSILIILSKLVHRKNDFITTISLSLLISLIFNPFCIFDIGLQLSYLSTIGIIIFFNYFEGIFKKQKLNKYIISNLSVSLSAQIFILPIIIKNYHSISLGFFISNIVTTPLIILILLGGYLIIFLSYAFLNLAIRLACVVDFTVFLFEKTIKFISEIKFLNFSISPPNIFLTIIYYFIIILIIYYLNIKNNKLLKRKIHNKKIIKKIIIFLLILFIFTNIIIKLIFLINNNLIIYFIDVGQR